MSDATQNGTVVANDSGVSTQNSAGRPELGPEAAQWLAGSAMSGPTTAPLVTSNTSGIAPGIQMVKRSRIRLDSSMQARAKTNEETVAEYAEALKQRTVFPPIDLVYDPTNDCFWPTDGFHRTLAADIAHEGNVDYELKANITIGSHRDAVLRAVEANQSHGLPRTNADKRRAVALMMQDEEWRAWSDRAIAMRAGVSHVFVGDVRREMFPEGAQQARRYTNKHGGESLMRIAPNATPPGDQADARVIGAAPYSTHSKDKVGALDSDMSSVEAASGERTASTKEPSAYAAKGERSRSKATKKNNISPATKSKATSTTLGAVPMERELARAREAARLVQYVAPTLMRAAEVLTGAACERFLAQYEALFSTAMRVLKLPMTVEGALTRSRKRAQPRSAR